MEMESKIEISIASHPDKDKLVAELFYKGVQWAAIIHEEEPAKLIIYPKQDGTPWEFEASDAIVALQRAKIRIDKDTMIDED